MATQFLVGDGAVDTPVSIYFGLEQGAKADLETVASAAIAWSTAFKTMVGAIEPGLSVEVQLVDGDEGSLWLNTLLSFIEDKFEQIARGAERYPRLKALARGLAIIVVATPIQMTAENVWQAVIGEEPELGQLSPEAQEQVKKAFRDVLAERVAERERERFARIIVEDMRIEAVGIASKPTARPTVLLDRSQIANFVNRERVDAEQAEVRKRTAVLDVLLVSPVLEEAERSWRFKQQGMPEFGAVMRDKGFLSAMGNREVHEELRFGIPMQIEIEFKERLDGEAWIVEERSVTRVITPKVDRSELPF